MFVLKFNIVSHLQMKKETMHEQKNVLDRRNSKESQSTPKSQVNISLLCKTLVLRNLKMF